MKEWKTSMLKCTDILKLFFLSLMYKSYQSSNARRKVFHVTSLPSSVLFKLNFLLVASQVQSSLTNWLAKPSLFLAQLRPRLLVKDKQWYLNSSLVYTKRITVNLYHFCKLQSWQQLKDYLDSWSLLILAIFQWIFLHNFVD